MKKKNFLLLPFLVFGMALAACTSANKVDPPSGDQTVEVTGVTLDQTRADVEVGKTVTLKATVSPDNATDKTVTWSTGNANIAKVNEGVVTGVKVGTTMITATVGAFSATCTITVKEAVAPKTLEKITVSGPSKTTYEVNEELDTTGLVVKAIYSNGDEEVLDASKYQISGFDSSAANYALVVTVTYQGKTATFTVKIVESGPVEDVYSIVGLIGGEDKWATDYVMTVNEGVATLNDLHLTIGDMVKIRVNKAWDVTYGASDVDVVNLSSDIQDAFDVTENQDNNIIVVLAGRYNFSLNLETKKILIDGEIDDEQPIIDTNYYLVGDVNGWETKLASYRFSVGQGDEAQKDGHVQYTLKGVILDANSKFKVYSNGHYYPDGTGNDMIAPDTAVYDVYFVAEGGIEGWLEGYCYLYKTDIPVIHSYGLVGSGSAFSSDWDVAHPLEMTEVNGVASVQVTFAADDLFKLVIDNAWLNALNATALLNTPEGAFVDDGTSEHNIKVVTGGDYVVSLNIETMRINIAVAGEKHAVGLAVTYTGDNLLVGETLDADKLSVVVGYSDYSLGTDELRNSATYWIGEEQIQLDHVFDAEATVTITVKCTVEEKELTGQLIIVVEEEGKVLSKYSVIGKFLSYNWNHDVEMYEKDGKATSNPIAFAAGDAFKVRYDGGWNFSYGYSDLAIKDATLARAFVLDKDGNVEVKYPGTYQIIFDITSKKIDITGTPLNPIPDEISVTFKLTYDVGYGNSILVAGNWDNWQLHNAQWTAGNVWTVTLNLPVEVGDTIEFKFVEDINGEHIYQKGDNNTYVIVEGENVFSLTLIEWDS